MNEELLKVGDVINLPKGQTVYGYMPEKFIFINPDDMNKLRSVDIVIGNNYSINYEQVKNKLINDYCKCILKDTYFNINEDDLREFLSSRFKYGNKSNENWIFPEGKYIVLLTKREGGSKVADYPDGHSVYCMSLLNETIIQFYQTGCFEFMIEHIDPVGHRDLTLEEKAIIVDKLINNE